MIIGTIVEQKGLGAKLGETQTNLGNITNYSKYASLVKDSEEGFNVVLMDYPMSDNRGPEVYLFPIMISEEKARKKYDELQ